MSVLHKLKEMICSGWRKGLLDLVRGEALREVLLRLGVDPAGICQAGL